ncbi:transcriptional regulator, AraC family [Haliangium ochraceum DSM 14365]|uniref:Transcriptional regulator, AraC family n=2 Tax=Haliangium ochraceum TaxID=80816 RepID=D0LQY3_HALO1|nr:transcriptional regulator, AraC family [Haliangium ochraceum DSM 14365]
MSDVLEVIRFSTSFFGRFVLGAPWALRIPEKPTSSFYAVAQGQPRLLVNGHAEPLCLAPGDVAIVPRGSGHQFDDGDRRAPPRQGFIDGAALRSATGMLGGAGAKTILIAGCFTFSVGARHPLLRALPAALHLPAHAPPRPELAATIQLITAESATPRPGSALILARLADVLLMQALRAQVTLSANGGLRALSDPVVGPALSLIHTRYRAPWTVAALATAVGVSRSGFAQRFRALLGEPPLRYLVGWRMTKAAARLRVTSDSVAEIADEVGYASAAAFSKAFKQWAGVGPDAFRRANAPATEDTGAAVRPSVT